MKHLVTRYFNSGWLPALSYLFLLIAFATATISRSKYFDIASEVLLVMAALAYLGLIVASFWNLVCKRWMIGIANILLTILCAMITLVVINVIMIATMFGPSGDGFADDLTIPGDIEVIEPDADLYDTSLNNSSGAIDDLQTMVRRSLSATGSNKIEFVPNVPSLRKASTDHAEVFEEFITASPDWHVFMERGNRFASRRWSYGGRPRDTLHGYVSEFGGSNGFQTRCLLCLDRKQWNGLPIQRVMEGNSFVAPQVTMGNNLFESRIIIDCGGVWIEVFEQSTNRERRITKATLAALEEEFSEFLRDPEKAINVAKSRSSELVDRIASNDAQTLRLSKGIQPGIYNVAYLLNPGEAGFVFLRAFEVTQGTPLSVERLEARSKTRMTWSSESTERFAATAEFTIYEGDWGKPYAARFEVWFAPDSGEPSRKLAERVFKIEGWER